MNELRLRNWRSMPRLRVAEVALVAGLSVRTVRRKIDRGELSVERQGGLVFVPILEVLRLVGEPTGPSGRDRIDDWAREILNHHDQKAG